MAVFISEHNEAQKYNSSLFDLHNVLTENSIKSTESSVPKSNMHNILCSNSFSSNIIINTEMSNSPNFYSSNNRGERHSSIYNIYEKFEASCYTEESESQFIKPVKIGSQTCEVILEKCNNVVKNSATGAIDILNQKKKNGFDEVLSNSQLDLHSNYSFTGHSYEAGVISFSDNMLWPSNLHMEDGVGEESASDFDLENKFSVDDKDFELMKYQVDETLQNFDICNKTENHSRHTEITVQIDNRSQVNNNNVMLSGVISHSTQINPVTVNGQNLVKEWNGNVQSRRIHSIERREPQTISDSESVDEIGVDIDSFECCGYAIDFKQENASNINVSCNESGISEENNRDENIEASIILHTKPVCNNNKMPNKEYHGNTRIKLIVNALKYSSIKDGIKPSKVKHLSSSESSSGRKMFSGNKRNNYCIEKNVTYGDHRLPNERHFNTMSSENRQNYSVT